MTDVEAFIHSREPVPVVPAGDLKRVCSLFIATSTATQPGTTSGICVEVIAGVCAPDTDPLAAWFRASMLQGLLMHGRLDSSRSGSTPPDRVFEVAAVFPFPNGPGEPDLDGLAAAIASAPLD